MSTVPGKYGRLGSAASAVAFARAFSLVAAIVQLPVLTRILDPSEYALVSLCMAAGLYFSLLSAESTILPFQRFPGSATDRANFSYALKRLAQSIVVLGLLVAAAGLCLRAADMAFALAGWGIGIAFNRFIATAWIMWGRPWPYSLTLILGTGMRVLVLISALSVGMGASWAVGLAGLVSGLAAVIVAPRRKPTLVPTPLKRPRRPWKLRFGVSLGLASLAFTVLLNFNLLFLPIVASPQVVGVYAAMNQVAVLSLGAALGVINTLLYPRLQAIWNVGGHAYIRSIVNCVCTASLCLGFASILLVQIVGTEVLTFVLGMSFVDTNALSLQIAATVLANVGQYLSWLHLFKVNSGRIRNVSLIAAGCGSALSVYMVLEFGIVGAGAGLLLSFLIYSGLMHAESTASRFLLLEFVVFAFVVLISQLVALWLTTFLIIVCMAVFGCAFFCRLKRLRSAQRHWKVLEIHAATVPGSQRES